MSNYIFGNKNFFGTQVIDKEDGNEMNIYANVDDINSHEVCRGTEDAETTRNQTSQHTGSECVKNRSFRSVSVCLVLLCVLLLTAVIVLCVLIYTNTYQNYIDSKNITEERDQLLTKYTNITEERDQLLTNYTNITEERDQLLTNYTNITEERDQLLTKYKNLTNEREQLLFKYITVTKENDRLLSNNTDLKKQRDQLTQQINELRKILNETDGWLYYKFSFYFISTLERSWSESRRYCTDRGADLIIINNKEEQDLVKKYSGLKGFWIGLTDSDVEGTWKWVDGSTMTLSFWASGEPNSYTGNEDCVASGTGWADWPCNVAFRWVCEKSIFKLVVK